MRQPKLGDTISCKLSVYSNNRVLSAELSTEERLEYAVDLVASGRWVISRCGACDSKIEDCVCVLKEKSE